LKSGSARSIPIQCAELFSSLAPALTDIAPFLGPLAQLGTSGINLPNQRDAFRIFATAKRARFHADCLKLALEPACTLRG